MTITDQLFGAILAMDAYNRGYGAQINLSDGGISETNKPSIGSATIIQDDGGPHAQTIGFYAVAYSWNGQTVISFRGTDNYDPTSPANDILNGWIGTAGSITTQAVLLQTLWRYSR